MRVFALLIFLIVSMQCVGQVEISGVVFDDLGEPLIGANILIKGSTEGTVSDLDGSFSLITYKKNPTIVISFVGLQTIEISPSEYNGLQITLPPEIDPLDCGGIVIPSTLGLIGPSYDVSNSLAGFNFDNFFPRLFFYKPVNLKINFRIGNNSRLSLENKSEITLNHIGSKKLVIEYDYLKNAWFDYDIIEGIDYRRFAIIPKLSKGRYTFEVGYINQKELGFFSKSQHGIVTGLGFQAPLNFSIQGRTELLLDEVQYKLELEKYIPTLRTSISVDYVHLEDFTSLSLSAQYKFWY